MIPKRPEPVDTQRLLAQFDRETEGERFFTFEHGEGWILFLAISVLVGFVTMAIAMIYTELPP